MMFSIVNPKKGLWSGATFFLLLLSPLFLGSQETDKPEKEKELTKITEEILVVGKAPKDLPLATVITLDTTKFDQLKPLDLSEMMKFAPGVFVTHGEKSEFNLKIRGIDSKRIALLIDGIPVYEPYYSSFDLKTIAAAGIDSLQITKGPSSVLYGPNTMGGIVNVITRRPGSEPRLSLNASYGEKNTRGVALDSAFQWNRFGVVGNVAYQDSDGFLYASPDGNKITRNNADYERFNLNIKAYYTPSSRTEIMLNGGVYHSEYGMPAALEVQRPRYWRFKNWDRYTLNAGGFTSLGRNSTLRFRAFWVQYKNTLDQYKDPEMTVRQFESTFDNSVYGLFALADFSLSRTHSLKISLTYQRDVTQNQDDVNFPWYQFDQGTLSAGIEDHLTLAKNWKLIGGLSLDYLEKYTGENTSKVNPMVGLKFTPSDSLDMHLSFSQKSKFPSMRSLYSPSSGNPDLLSERGQNAELGLTYSKNIFLTGAVFFGTFKDLIDSIRLPDGTRRYFNIGQAHINGFEIQLQKSLSWTEATVNYTYLDHRNESDDRPLDALSSHGLNFDLQFFPFRKIRLGLYGLYASSSSWYDSTSRTLLTIPAYFTLDGVAAYRLDRLELFIKAGNIFNRAFFTEPGFPWRGRFVEFGIRADVLK